MNLKKSLVICKNSLEEFLKIKAFSVFSDKLLERC